MALPTTLSKVRIEGNSIDTGTYFNGVSVTDYTYSYAMDISASGTIKNNIISGCIGSSTTSTNLVSIANASCNISGNQFVRGSSDLNAYINITGTNDQIITGNVFDKSEASSGDELLVKGLTENSTYNNNKNQVGYATIMLGSYSSSRDPASNDGAIGSNTAGSTGTQRVFAADGSNIYAHARVRNNNTGFIYVQFFAPIETSVPKGAKIDSIKIGFKAYDNSASTINTGASNYIGLGLYVHSKNIEYVSAGTGSTLDPDINTQLSTNYVDHDFNSTGAFADLKTTAEYLSIAVPTAYKNSSKENYFYSAVVSVANRISGGDVEFRLSPIVVKYIY